MNETIRSRFPILSRIHNEKPLIFLDGPAGTHVPISVVETMSQYYYNSNANTHGAFATTRETDKMLHSVRSRVASFLGAEGPKTVSFGQNMTSLNFKLARAFSRVLQPGDEVLITQLDHEANRGPWLTLRQHGIIVREVAVKPDGTLHYEDFQKKINERTRLVAMGYASNIFGTVNDVALVRQWTYKVGALLLLDAVHYAPHFSIDVQSIGCDFLLCSAYKFYGPHVGLLYSKPGTLDTLPTDRLRTADQMAPHNIETGTLNHAALAGVGAAVDFIATFGESESLRLKLISGMNKIRQHERSLANRLYEGLQTIDGLKIYGPSIYADQRAPTISFMLDGHTSLEVCQALAAKGICAWDGHFYAIKATEVLGLLEKGGVTRMGIVIYNTEDEVDYTIQSIKEIIQ